MSSGKLAAQAGHAFLGTLQVASQDPEHAAKAADYTADSPGTKVVLKAGLSKLLAIAAAAKADCLPHYLVIDRGHVHPPDFDGSPIVTALGIGPACRRDVQSYLRKLKPC